MTFKKTSCDITCELAAGGCLASASGVIIAESIPSSPAEFSILHTCTQNESYDALHKKIADDSSDHKHLIYSSFLHFSISQNMIQTLIGKIIVD